MTDRHSPSKAGAELTSVVCKRHLWLPITASAATRDRLTIYLALVDRPLTSFLARERLSQEGPGRLIYRSNPHRVLHLEVVPTLSIAAEWTDGRLEVSSTGCRLAGLGAWGDNLGFRLRATLEPGESVIAGWAEVALQSRLVQLRGARRLAHRALEHVLDRIERRLERGFQKDVVAWLGLGEETERSLGAKFSLDLN